MMRDRSTIRVDHDALSDADVSWMADAACHGRTRLFFSTSARGRYAPGTLSADQEAAIAICTTCPVRIDCLAYAFITRQEYGIWGGLTEAQRRQQIRRRRRLEVTA
jgi:WhiB family redox-sensing transcriptional regulator